MAQVTLSGLTKRFRGAERASVEDVSLQARDGEFLVLVGPSGCGKSTTLRAIAGLEAPEAGEIRIGERRVNDLPPAERDIAMIFQNYALYPHMTVYENLGFGLRMRRTARPEIDRRVREVAELLGLTGKLNRLPRALSGGERQRVAVGRAIVREPAVFLFDEPLSNLDAKMRVAMRREIRDLHRRLGTTMIYVTHDQTEAMTMGDRIAVMHEGRLRQIDEPTTVYRQPADAFVAGFIGSPPMNFVRGEIGGEAGALRFDGEGLSLPLPGDAARAVGGAGRKVLLGIRPEDLLESAAEGIATAPIAATIVRREPLGAETIVEARAGEASLLARVGADFLGAAGEAIELLARLDRLHFFDAGDEKRLA
jgi:multiple sugar transport system ATP-binding protein